MIGSTLPEPRADTLIASYVLGDDDDYVIDAAGHDGDLYWVTYVMTNSGYGIEGVEEVHTVMWGDGCSPIAFVAGAPTESGRNELITAFVGAVATVSKQR